ncbi:MAG: hypothetical protein JWQ01_1684 [Massilia sp.]|jgi:hypothetical protein|nr:hypothetical protein [Massilia sp.]
MPAIVHPATAPAAQIAVVSADWAAAGQRAPAPRAVPKREVASAPVSVPPAALTDQRIKVAVAETIAAAPANASASPSAALSADNSTVARQIASASVPGCHSDDGLKFQPPRLGPVVFSGLFTLPFLIVAKVRGKCK